MDVKTTLLLTGAALALLLISARVFSANRYTYRGTVHTLLGLGALLLLNAAAPSPVFPWA